MGKQTLTTAVVIAVSIAIIAPDAVAADPSNFLQSAPGHQLYNGHLPPGVIGATRRTANPYFQPVAFSGPDETEFALAESSVFGAGDPNLMAGLIVGEVYRFRISRIPGFAGAELYPTIELIDRTYPPPGLATSYPIRINLDDEDFRAALDGRLVTRVIYLEDTDTAQPIAEKPTTSRALDVAEYQDPLAVADRFGRPVAIVRLGSVAPPSSAALMPGFLFGFPVWAPIFQPEQPEQQQ